MAMQRGMLWHAALALRGMQFMPTGGINADNIRDYLNHKQVVSCGGSWIMPKDKINADDWDGITKLCMDALDKIKATDV